MRKKIVVLSEDALADVDMGYLSALPNFERYIKGGAMVKNFRSIYPTTTYIDHTSMITGCYPDKHGVLSNDAFRPGDTDAPWNWFASAIKCEDVFTAAKRAGYSTASVFWPVTGNHKSIDYLIDEIWKHGEIDTNKEALRRSGTSDELMREVVEPNMFLFPDRTMPPMCVHPNIDTFILNCAVEIIERYKPDLFMLHPAQIDAAKHGHSITGEHIDKAIEEADKHIGMIGRALEKADILDETDFILISDHGQREFGCWFFPHTEFIKRGIIKAEDGVLKDWDAWVSSQGFSGLVYLKNPSDKAVYHKVYETLCYFKALGIVSDIYDGEKLEKQHLGKNISFAFETNQSFGISTSLASTTLVKPSYDETRGHIKTDACHGYSAMLPPYPVFYAKGPSFVDGAVRETASLVDLAPTIAEIFDFKLSVDGKVMSDLLKKQGK